MTIRVGIDARRSARSGLATYTAALITGLHRVKPEWRLVLLGDASLNQRYPFAEVLECDTSDRTLLDWVGLSRTLLRARLDVWVAVQYWSPPITAIPEVRVVHDVYPLLEGAVNATRQEIISRFGYEALGYVGASEELSWIEVPEVREIMEGLFRRGISAARAIVVPSETTAAEVAWVFPQYSSKMLTIPHALATDITPKCETLGSSPSSDVPLDLLVVGNWEPRRRLGELIETVEPLWACGIVDRLTIVGRPVGNHHSYFEKLETLMGAAESRGWLRRFASIPDEELTKLYTAASALIVSSQHEGFCYPALEAMSLGVPVIAPAGTAVEDLCGPVALYFEDKVADIVRPISALLGSTEDEIRVRVKAGLRRSQRFSLKHMANAYTGVIQTLLDR